MAIIPSWHDFLVQGQRLNDLAVSVFVYVGDLRQYLHDQHTARNRAAERDRYQASEDYKVNIEAKIEELQIALARIENNQLSDILNMLNTLQKVNPRRGMSGQPVFSHPKQG